MKIILPIAKKEFRQIVRDPRTLGVLVLVPIFLLLMFGYAISLDVKHISLEVVDYSRTAASRSLVRRLSATEYFDMAGYAESTDAADFILESGEAQCILVIPVDYHRRIVRGGTAELQVLIDGSNSNIGATAMGYIQRIIQDVSVQILEEKRGMEIDGGVELRSRVWFNPELRSPVFLIPGLISLILMVTAVISTAMSIVREKEQGTMEQLIVAPISPLQLVIGKTIPYTILSLVIAVMILMAGSIFFDIEIQGSFGLLMLVSFIFLLGCLGLGILISTIADSQQVAFMLATIITLLPTFILSGFIFPIDNMPVPIQAVTYIIPARYYLVALRGIMLKGTGIAPFLDEVAALLLFAVLTMTVSAFRMRKGRLA